MTTEKKSPPDHNQYGLKDDTAVTSDIYANRPGGEQAVVGPADAVDASGHRIGNIEEHPTQKPSSRTGRAVFSEVDNKKRT